MDKDSAHAAQVGPEIGTVCPSCGTVAGNGRCGNTFHASAGFGAEGSPQKGEERTVRIAPAPISFRTIRTL